MHTLRLYCPILLSLSILFSAPLCRAEEPTAIAQPIATSGFPFTGSPTKEVKAQPINNNISLIKTFGGLTMVLGMIFLMAKMGKKFHPSINAPDRALKIVSMLSLGTKEKVALIQVGSKQVLIGVTPQSINTLLDIAEPIHFDSSTTANSKSILSARTASEFSRKLNEFLLTGQRNK
ncbi:MAG TPA: flagellar biosynthetic protein FliO [Cellvibrionaceae bacterium]|nr:flagellar biosynthetic protein FliO [Cellvibrionaceae bacterium]HMW49278.1 flagellar biosynthetic protein FliO [Cellvibrionaceae bacterium]HMW72943.1 flagellar biosynthetic protein FliO [Cellvibrionaceae bacterium]HMY39256.1 flagellar biosynthetic protein FliO [Marinagarivorans sp.]